MKILVTGSDGYIGTQLVQVLIAHGHDVTGLDTGFYRAGWLYNGATVAPRTITKDTRHVTVDDLKGYEAVVHLAELCNDPLSQNDPEVTLDINHRGTMNIARLAKEAGVSRFVYFSSCSIYGASDGLSDETSPTNPLTFYAQCKIKNEAEMRLLADDTFTPTYMRNATVCGPSPRMRFDLVVNNLSGAAWVTNEIKMDSDGTPWRPFIHILDVCEATNIILMAPKEKIYNEIFNIGDTNSNYQIKDIAQIISEVFPGCKVSLNKAGADKRNYRVNFDKIATVLGFSCKRNVKIAAQELKDIYTSVALGEPEIHGRRYIRLEQIKYLKETGQIDDRLFWKKMYEI